CVVAIATGIERFVPMKANIDEVSCDVFQQRPSMRRVGYDKSDALTAEKRNEARIAEAGVANLDRVPQAASRRLDQPGACAGDAVIVTPRELERGSGVTGQPRDEFLHALGIERHLRWELPKHRAELASERQHARGEEVRERGARVPQLLHMRDETRPFHGEHEVRRRFVMPLLPSRGRLQRVERAVNLDRSDLARREFEFLALRQSRRIENAPPWRVSPARDSYAQAAASTSCPAQRGIRSGCVQRRPVARLSWQLAPGSSARRSWGGSPTIHLHDHPFLTVMLPSRSSTARCTGQRSSPDFLRTASARSRAVIRPFRI